ncbi:MAG TPA: DUF3566 domain-containing protein [Actinotalea sp.]|nr:DUF3566 domain-containing protein [Actinotalea sp.]
MSTESQPPSIAPQRPEDSPWPEPSPRRVTPPVSGDGPPSGGVTFVPGGAPGPAPITVPSPAGPTPEVTPGPSLSDRVKKAAQGAAGAVKSAVPTRAEPTDTAAARATATGAPQVPAPARAPGAPSPATATAPAPGRAATASGTAAASGGPRRVRLAIARIDPWSVMKLSFLLSFAIGIMIVVAAAVVWQTLDSLAVFTQVNDIIATLSGSPTFFDLLEYAKFERVISLAAMIAVADIVLLTALATIGAFLYNIVAAMVGGIHLTLTDD